MTKQEINIEEAKFTQIPETTIMESAEVIARENVSDEENNFLKLLNTGREYKAAGMHPIYMVDNENNNIIMVTPAEYMTHRLH